jgi:hypothetical protein
MATAENPIVGNENILLDFFCFFRGAGLFCYQAGGDIEQDL